MTKASRTAADARLLKAALILVASIGVDTVAAAPLPRLGQIQQGTTELFELPGHTCADGSPYVYAISKGENAVPNSNGKFQKVMVEFMGGGMCFDNFTCSGSDSTLSLLTPNTFDFLRNVISWSLGMTFTGNLNQLIGLSQAGLFKAERSGTCLISYAGVSTCADARLADYLQVFLFYCTGDVFGGNNTAIYTNVGSGTTITMRHYGYDIVRAILGMIEESVGSEVTDVIVAGGSAGSFASQFWGPILLEMLDQRSIYGAANSAGSPTLNMRLLLDSSFHASSPDANVAIQGLWQNSKWQIPQGAIVWRNQVLDWDFQSVAMKHMVSYYDGRLKVAFLGCSHDQSAEIWAQYLKVTFANQYDRVATQWKYLDDIHYSINGNFTSSSTACGSTTTNKVFSYFFNGTCHHPSRDQVYANPGRIPNQIFLNPGDHRPNSTSWINNFLATGAPFVLGDNVSQMIVRQTGAAFQITTPADLDFVLADPRSAYYWGGKHTVPVFTVDLPTHASITTPCSPITSGSPQTTSGSQLSSAFHIIFWLPCVTLSSPKL